MTRHSLSIVLTNYNHAQFLPRALTAIMHQSRQPDELILIDDASTDNSVEVMEAFAAKYPLIRIVRNEKNIGCVAGVIKGTELASGDYFQRAAADDYMLPGFIEKLMAMAERYPKPGIVSSALATVAGKFDTDLDGQKPPTLNPNAEFFSLKNCPTGYYTPDEVRRYHDTDACSPMGSVAPATLYNIEVVKGLGGWATDIGSAWECTFMLQAASLKAGMAYTEEPLYSWVFRPKSITDRELEDVAQLRATCDRYAEKITEPPFDALFTTRFGERWKREADIVIANCTPKPSFFKRLVNRLVPQRREVTT